MRRTLAVLACLFIAMAGAHAQPLRVIAFAGASNLPLWAGQAQNFFARRGIAVDVTITPSSEQMARDLMAGKADLALTSIDNIVAYDEAEVPGVLPGPANFVALFGVDDGMLSVVADRTIPDLAGLAGLTFAVDAPTTGYAFTMRAVMDRHHLTPAQLPFVAIGGGAQRLQALLAGDPKATLLNTPLDIAAEAQGFHSLARITDEIGPYQGIAAAVRRDRLATDRGKLVAFTAGFHDAVAWLAAPANRQAGVELLMHHTPGMTQASAEAATAAILDPRHGIFRDLRISPAGLRTVLALRSKYAEPPRPLRDPARYTNDTIRAEAANLR